MKKITTKIPCTGFLDHLRCPYNAYTYNEKKERVCRIHMHTTHAFRLLKYEPIDFTTWMMGKCELCESHEELCYNKCQTHRICYSCREDAAEFKECPLCLSLRESSALN